MSRLAATGLPARQGRGRGREKDREWLWLTPVRRADMPVRHAKPSLGTTRNDALPPLALLHVGIILTMWLFQRYPS
jgi:hypothetical protein